MLKVVSRSPLLQRSSNQLTDPAPILCKCPSEQHVCFGGHLLLLTSRLTDYYHYPIFPFNLPGLMHEIEPYYNWLQHYEANKDARSPFFGYENNLNQYENTIYGYYIHPLWDDIGSETLYIKVLMANYDRRFVIIELFGEWNDTLHNDIMFLKRKVIDEFTAEGINQFILIGENVFNFHGSDDEYYAEWFDDVEDGWIAAVSFPEHVEQEWIKYHLDYYINFGGTLHINNWRTMQPLPFYELVKTLIIRRLA